MTSTAAATADKSEDDIYNICEVNWQCRWWQFLESNAVGLLWSRLAVMLITCLSDGTWQLTGSETQPRTANTERVCRHWYQLLIDDQLIWEYFENMRITLKTTYVTEGSLLMCNVTAWSATVVCQLSALIHYMQLWMLKCRWTSRQFWNC